MRCAALCAAALATLIAASPDDAIPPSRRLALKKLEQAPPGHTVVNKAKPSVDVQKKLCQQRSSIPGLMGRALGCSTMLRSILDFHPHTDQSPAQVRGGDYKTMVYVPANTGKSIEDIFKDPKQNKVDDAVLDKYEKDATRQKSAPWHTRKVDKIATADIPDEEVPLDAQPYKARGKDATMNTLGGGGVAKAFKEPEVEVPLAAQPYKAKESSAKDLKLPKGPEETPLPDEVTPYKAKENTGGKAVAVPKALKAKEAEIPLSVQPYKALD